MSEQIPSMSPDLILAIIRVRELRQYHKNRAQKRYNDLSTLTAAGYNVRGVRELALDSEKDGAVVEALTTALLTMYESATDIAAQDCLDREKES